MYCSTQDGNLLLCFSVSMLDLWIAHLDDFMVILLSAAVFAIIY